jgi:hypothetical protein
MGGLATEETTRAALRDKERGISGSRSSVVEIVDVSKMKILSE